MKFNNLSYTCFRVHGYGVTIKLYKEDNPIKNIKSIDITLIPHTEVTIDYSDFISKVNDYLSTVDSKYNPPPFSLEYRNNDQARLIIREAWLNSLTGVPLTDIYYEVVRRLLINDFFSLQSTHLTNEEGCKIEEVLGMSISEFLMKS